MKHYQVRLVIEFEMYAASKEHAELEAQKSVDEGLFGQLPDELRIEVMEMEDWE